MKQIDPGVTLLEGEITDQAALFGLIGKLRDLGVNLLGVTYAQTEAKQKCTLRSRN